MIFQNKTNYPFGLDFSDLSLKLVQLSKKGNKIKIQALSKKDLPSGLIVDGHIKKEDEVIAVLREMIEKPEYGKVTSSKVVACLPETKTFIQLLEIEESSGQVVDIIESEIEKNIPLAIDEIYYDWQIMENKTDYYQVLVGVAPKKISDQYIQLLDKAKLSVEALEIEPTALCRSLLKEEMPKQKNKKSNYGIIDIGAKRTSFILYAHNTILFTVSMPISGEKISQEIAEALQIDIALAEKAKIVCGLDKRKAKGVINKILDKTIEELTFKISQALDYFQNHYGDRGLIDGIILCGGGANIKNIDMILQEKIKENFVIGSPIINLYTETKNNFSILLSETHDLDVDFLKKMKKIEKVQKINDNEKIISITQDTSSTFSTAIGLALRGIFLEDL